MANYNNSVVVKFDTKENGNAGAGSSVTVYYAGTNTEADIIHDGSDPTANPLFADAEGNYSFEVNDGFYDIVINEGLLSEQKIENQQIATIISFDSATGHYESVQDAIASPIEVGEIITTAGYYNPNDGGAGQYIVVAGGTGTDDDGSYLDMTNGNQLELIVTTKITFDQFGGNVISACAFASQEDIYIIGTGNAINITSSTTIEPCEIQNVDFNISSGFALNGGTDCVFYDCSFSGGGRLQLSYDVDFATIILCKFFDGSYISCVSGFNRGPQNITVTLCETDESPLIYGTTLNNSKIVNNKVNATGIGFSISYAGENNIIKDNEVWGGLTGIIGIPNRSTNQRQNLSNNVVSDNHVHDILEEGISFDCRGNSNTDGLAVASTTIDTASGDDVTFADVFPTAYQQLNQYIVFQTGNRKGEYYKIVYTGDSGLGPYQLENYTSDSDDIGQTVTVQIGGFGNIIENNFVEDTGRAGVLIYGSFVGSVVRDNRTKNTGTEGVGGGGVACRSLSGITSTINNSYQPCHHTSFYNNYSEDDDISSGFIEYNGTTLIEPVGLIFDNNRVSQNKGVILEVGENIKERNSNNLQSDLTSIISNNGITEVHIPLMTLTSGVASDVYDIELPSNFASHVETDVLIGLPKCTGSANCISVGMRSNETTSVYGATDNLGALLKNINEPANRDIDSITISSQIISTATIGDTATMRISVNVVLSGALSPTEADASIVVKYRVTNKD